MSGLLAACSGGASQFGIPSFTGSTSNQKAIIGGEQPMPPQPAAYTPPVQRTDLPPPASSQPLLPGVAPAQQAAAAPMAATATATAVAAGKGAWSTVGANTVTLGPGETLSSISRRYGVPVKELAKANGISDPSMVTAGMRIAIPTYGVAGGTTPKPAEIAEAPKPATAPEGGSLGGVHTVSAGQTLSSIARLYNVSPTELAAANDLSSANQVQTGQKLKIPGQSQNGAVALRPDPARREDQANGEDANKDANGQSTVVAGAAADPATTASINPSAANEAAKEMEATAAKPQAAAYAPADDKVGTAAAADPGSANGTSFRWPVRGRIIGSFGPSPTGEKNDGINLAVPEGTSIKAVEAGTVIYAGNELEGYGELVLVRHADGWVSAYAHNSDILVKRGDTVRRGQIITRAGKSGDVSSPQLHFELRKGSKPVNPLDYLQG